MIRRHNDTAKKVPLFAGLGIIEKFSFIFLPALMMFVVYSMLGGMDWWIKFIISVGGVSLLLVILFLVVGWLVRIYE